MADSMPLTFPIFGEEEFDNLRECLDSGWVTQGPFVKKLEELHAARHEVKYAYAVTSCTAALHIATVSLGLGPGDEVIVPAFTWVTSANCAEYTGAKAVFADVDPTTFNLDPQAVEAAITPNTRAIVAVHLFGLSADMDAINAIAQKHDLAVIEDAACAVGSTYKGRPVGGLGDIGCFSFHPRKVITTGEGGMLTTNHKNLADMAFSLRSHGSVGFPKGTKLPAGPYVMDAFANLGYNYRMSDIQGAVGVAQWRRLDQLLDERSQLAKQYTELMQDMDEISLPIPEQGYGHTYQSFVIRLTKHSRGQRNAVMDSLKSDGIMTRPGTHAVHRLDYYADKYALKAEDYPNATLCEDTSITLPMFPGMKKSQQEKVVIAIQQAM